MRSIVFALTLALAASGPLAAVAQALCERFDVSVEECRLDVGEFYDRLRDEKLVRPAR